MADNYLGKKMEDYMAGRGLSSTKKSQPSLHKLLLRNRSHRAYDNSFTVREDQLRKIIDVNTKTPSARNQQVLRFRPVLKDEAQFITPYIKLGGALPELNLPQEGLEPNAYIIICTTKEEDRWVDVDLGISAQSMLLQATEIGLNGICIGAFNKEAIKETFKLQYEPLLILGIGRGAERILLTEIEEGADHKYYRKDGVHYVPKLRLEELIIK